MWFYGREVTDLSTQWLLFSYAVAGLAAILLLLVAGARRWYWHGIGLLIGLVAGLLPPFGGPGGNLFYLVTGTLCVFFLIWGAGGPVLRLIRGKSRF